MFAWMTWVEISALISLVVVDFYFVFLICLMLSCEADLIVPFTDVGLFTDWGIWRNNWHVLGLHRRRWVFWDPCNVKNLTVFAKNVRDQSFSSFINEKPYRGIDSVSWIKCTNVRNIQSVTWFLYACWVFMWYILSQTVVSTLKVKWLMACSYLHWRQKFKSQFNSD